MIKLFNFKNITLYVILGVLIFTSVFAVLSLNSIFKYYNIKSKMETELIKNTEESLVNISKNIVHKIQSYSINEYEKILNIEIEQKKWLAIILEDYNMGEIVGKEYYLTGKIIDKNGSIVDIDLNNPNHKLYIANSYYHSQKIIKYNNKDVAKLTIYSSDDVLKTKLNELMLDTLYNTLLISFILILILFFAINRYVLQPIYNIVDILQDSTQDGIPTNKIKERGSKEVYILSSVINNMIDKIKASTTQLQIQTNRFQLAIDGTLDGLWDWDIKTDKIYKSERYEKMLGYDKNELDSTKETIFSLIHPDDLFVVNNSISKYFNDFKNSVFEEKFRMKHKHNEYIWIKCRGKALFENGEPVKFVAFNTDITEDINYQNKIEYSAKHDYLTDLPNRFLFSELLQKSMINSINNNKILVLMYIDIDNFKEINDTFGHEAGDILIVSISQRFKSFISNEDSVARLGGDEFVISLLSIDNINKLDNILSSLLKLINKPILYLNNELIVSASIGVTLYPQSNDIGTEALIRQADKAMYIAKDKGKNQYHLFDLDNNETIKKHHNFLNEFNKAIQNNEIVIHYQPKVDMLSGSIYGFEALVRWQHPTNGLMFPDSFLPKINSEKEVMLNLSHYIFDNVFNQISIWKNLNLNFTISINVSSHEFCENYLLNTLNTMFEKYINVKPKDIELEILETHALENIKQAKEIIVACNKLGVKVALDDFGTGYSTLSYLKDLPIDTVKIDKSFVMDMLDDNGSFSIVDASIGLAQAFRCNIVAEGVESINHGKMLLRLGCNIAQGYVISKPMDSNSIEKWISNFIQISEWKNIKQVNSKDLDILYLSVIYKSFINNIDNDKDILNIQKKELLKLIDICFTKLKVSLLLEIKIELQKDTNQSSVSFLNEKYTKLITVIDNYFK